MLGGVNVNISGTGRGGKIVLDGDLELGSKLLLKDDEVYMLEDGDYKYHPLIIEN
jgi:hypothetical protein